ncbi:MAG: hypothetical protein WBD81_17885 [Collimonas pratensis]|uniref:hypothetical protein n=1 Tax=Collimonas pratensis TaxID=279113 RepID=UPI003C76FF5F
MPTERFRNPQRAGYANGAAALDRIGEEAYRLDAENQRAAHQAEIEELERRREERIERMEIAHQKTVDAIEERKAKSAEAAAARRQVYEDRMAKAIPELYKINPNDPKAEEKRADIASRYPDLFHDEKGLPSIKSEFENHGRLVQQFQLQTQKSQAAKDALALKQGTVDKLTKEGGMTPTQAVIDGVTYKSPKTNLRENHEKEKDYVARQLSAMEKANPTLFNSTGLYTDEKGVQRFGFADKEKDDATTIAKPEDIRQWNAYQGLKNDYDLHDKALSGIRRSELAAAGALPTETTDLPPATDADRAANSKLEKDSNAAAGVPSNPNVAPTPPDAPTPPPRPAPVGAVADVTPPSAATPAADAAPAAHPLEGQTVRNKKTGAMGKIVNGEFVPN